MKRSIGTSTQVLFTTAGGCGRTGAVNAQCSFHVAPSATQRLSVSICFGVSVLCEDSGRHPARFLLVRDPLNDEAFGRLARDDRGTRFALGKSSFPGIEPQAGHARVLVRPVAMEAVVRQDGPDFTLEINCGVG